MQCETEVPSGKANGDICVEAAMLLVSDPQLGGDVPDEFREMKEDQRVKIALRLLERGVDSSNLARARAYDWYNKIGFLGMSPYADAYRAKELMDMMVKSGYPGGVLRKIRTNTSIFFNSPRRTRIRRTVAASQKKCWAKASSMPTARASQRKWWEREFARVSNSPPSSGQTAGWRTAVSPARRAAIRWWSLFFTPLVAYHRLVCP